MAEEEPKRIPPKVRKAQKYQSILLSDANTKQKLRAIRGLARLKNVIVQPDPEEERKENLTITALQKVISLAQPEVLYEKALQKLANLAPAGPAQKEELVKFYGGILTIPMEGPTYSPKAQEFALARLAKLGNVISPEGENLTLRALRHTISSEQPQSLYESALKGMLKLTPANKEDKAAQIDFYESLLISRGMEFNPEMGREYTTGKPAYSLKARKLTLTGLAKIGDVETDFGSWNNATIKVLVDFISPEEGNIICESALKTMIKLNPLSDSDKENLSDFYHQDILLDSGYSLKTRKLAIDGLEKLGEAERLEFISTSQNLEEPLRQAAARAYAALREEKTPSQEISTLTPKRIPKKRRRLVA